MSGDALYVASDAGFLYKLDKRTGREAWRAKIDTGSPERISPIDDKSRWDRYSSSVVSDGARVYVGSRDRNLYALDVATGKEIWRVTTGDMITATPALHQDCVLVASFDGKVQARQTSDGKLRWSYDAKLPVAGDLVIASNVGYGAFPGVRSGGVVGIDRASGRLAWLFVVPPSQEVIDRKREWGFGASPLVADGVVYAADLDGKVYAIRP